MGAIQIREVATAVASGVALGGAIGGTVAVANRLKAGDQSTLNSGRQSLAEGLRTTVGAGAFMLILGRGHSASPRLLAQGPQVLAFSAGYMVVAAATRLAMTEGRS